MDFVDSIHGAAATTFRANNVWAYTSDGGLTWHPSNYGTESWTIRAVKGTKIFFAIPEGLSLNVIDMAGGTGDIALRMLQKPRSRVTCVDINPAMMAIGHGKEGANDSSKVSLFGFPKDTIS